VLKSHTTLLETAPGLARRVLPFAAFTRQGTSLRPLGETALGAGPSGDGLRPGRCVPTKQERPRADESRKGLGG